MNAYTHQEYPRMVFHPESGESRVAATEADVPHGWLTTHPANTTVAPRHAVASHAAAAKGSRKAATPSQAQPDPAPNENAPDAPDASDAASDDSMEDRASIVAALRERGIKFNTRASTATLRSVLEA